MKVKKSLPEKGDAERQTRLTRLLEVPKYPLCEFSCLKYSMDGSVCPQNKLYMDRNSAGCKAGTGDF